MTTSTMVLTVVALFLGMLVATELGRWTGGFIKRKFAPQDPMTSFGAAEGAVFGLMGLLLAFTFSNAAGRFEQRRQSVVEEANAIRSAWERVDLLPDNRQSEIRDEFRKYLDTRLSFYNDLSGDLAAAYRDWDNTVKIQRDLWKRAVAVSGENPGAGQILPALNTMENVTTSGTELAKTHLPLLMRTLLIILPIICAFLVGMRAASVERRSWIHMLVWSLFLALVVYVIFDLDYPRQGIIRISDTDQVLIDLRTSMGN